ncbi:tyrosine-protein kinase domain-containing protein [Myxosarcina sp. GI1]|uniref:GumC family protein n=1 Tax=Myxosarcina sp. GI1 TaxID=1541065 RepID=UPI00068BE8E1|nr:tyrosine-protein kinase domain-containing protein [Myxosarcina sp. GI1]
MQNLLNDFENEPIAPVQQGFNFSGLLKTVKRNALPIAGISGVITLVTWLASSTLPTYSGDFQLLVEPVTSEAKYSEPSTLTSSSKAGNVGSLEMDYSTVITILKSPAMLASIGDRVRLQYPSFTQKELRDNLKIKRLNIEDEDMLDRTKIIEVSYEDSNPELVSLVLDEAAQKYLSYSLEDRKNEISQGVEFIEQQLPELNQRVSNLQIKLQQLREQNKFIDPEAKGEDLLKEINNANLQFLQTQSELEQQKALKRNLEQQLNMSPQEATQALTLSESPNYQKLLDSLKTLEIDISAKTALFQNDSPQLQTLYDERQKLLTLLDRETQRILGQSYNSKLQNSPLLKFQSSVNSNMIQQLVAATNQAKLLEIQLSSLASLKSKLEQQSQQLPKVSRQYTEVKKELAIASQTLEQLLTQRDALRVELAQSQVPWEIVSSPQLLSDATGNPAPLPGDSEKKLMMLFMGSLFLGVGTSVVFEKSRDIFYSAEDIVEQVDSPLLGVIPFNSEDEREEVNSNYSVLDAFDSLYANIKLRFNDRQIHSLIISSVSEKDEKSAIALLLAETAAAMGQKVLLVDANFRTPSIHYKLNLANNTGLSDLLCEQTDLDFNDFIQRDPQRANLFVLTSGEVLPNSTRMLASDRMQNLNQKFQETFDLVIYDTSAFLTYMDTSFLAAHADGIIMVVKVGQTQKSSVIKAVDQIEKFQLKNLGVIALDSEKQDL